MNILEGVWDTSTDVFWAIARFLYGSLLDDGLGKFFAVCLTAIAVVYFIMGYRSVVEWFRASDVKWDVKEVERYNLHRQDQTHVYKIDWKMAHQQKAISLRFTVPLGALSLGSLVWLRFSFTANTYMTIAVCWLAFAVILRIWWINTARKLAQRMVAHNYLLPEQFVNVVQPLHTLTLRQAVTQYVAWGTQASVSEGGLIGRFRWWANPLAKLFRMKFLRSRLVRPVIRCTFYALIWPIAMVVAPFYMTHELIDTSVNELMKPPWARRHAPAPDPQHGIIKDTPGDAGAAAE